MGSTCSKFNNNKVSTTTTQDKNPTEEQKKSVSSNKVPENPPEIKKKDSVPLAKLFDLMDKENKSKKNENVDLQRPTVPSKINSKPKELTFLSNPLPLSVLTDLGGGIILKIQESGRVSNSFGDTLGFFRDHYYYTSETGLIFGKLDGESWVRNIHGTAMGRISGEGMVLDIKGITIGKIEEESKNFRNEKYVPIGKAEGELKRLAMIYYFFFEKTTT